MKLVWKKKLISDYLKWKYIDRNRGQWPIDIVNSLKACRIARCQGPTIFFSIKKKIITGLLINLLLLLGCLMTGGIGLIPFSKNAPKRRGDKNKQQRRHESSKPTIPKFDPRVEQLEEDNAQSQKTTVKSMKSSLIEPPIWMLAEEDFGASLNSSANRWMKNWHPQKHSCTHYIRYCILVFEFVCFFDNCTVPFDYQFLAHVKCGQSPPWIDQVNNPFKNWIVKSNH